MKTAGSRKTLFAAFLLAVWGAPAEARFLQVDPVGYKDQNNLYAYVGNDPINRADPTGMTCESSERDGKTVYSCHIDLVRAQGQDGHWTTRAPTAAENRRFSSFNARYTSAVNRLASHPNRSATVPSLRGRDGSFRINAGEAAASLAAREFVFVETGMQSGTLLQTGGVYNPTLSLVEGARTNVSPRALSGASEVDIVHDGGMHGTYQEWTGRLQDRSYPLAGIDHQREYNGAACSLLGGGPCDH